MTKIAICGACGQMGHTIYKTLLSSTEFEISFGVDGYNSGDLPYPIFPTFDDATTTVDAVIDFSNPNSLDSVLDYALSHNTKLVLATTGHSAEQQAKIISASEKISIFKASNMSLGVNLLANLAKEAAKFLGDDYDVEIIETHHNKKLDAPSGTAITLANAIQSVRDLQPIYGRHHDSQRRSPNEIGIHAVRGGTVVGKHDVCFFGKGEVLKLSHESESKELFVLGALRATKFLIAKQNGLYDMNSIIADEYAVTTIAREDNNALIALDNIPANSFSKLLLKIKEHNIILDMISQAINKAGAVSISFSLQDKDSEEMMSLLSEMNLEYAIYHEATKINIEGPGMEHKSGVALDVLNYMRKAGASVLAITTSETKISCCIETTNADIAVETLKSNFQI